MTDAIPEPVRQCSVEDVNAQRIKWVPQYLEQLAVQRILPRPFCEQNTGKLGNWAQSDGKSGHEGEAILRTQKLRRLLCSAAREIRSSRT